MKKEKINSEGEREYDIFVRLHPESVDEITKPYRDKIFELEAEISKLKHDLEMSPITFDSEKELKAYKKFCKKHKKCQLSAKANGGKVPYIVLNGTGVGTCKKVICQVCGKEQDITDISVW